MFEILFKEISPEEISDDVFTLPRKVFIVITAGNVEHYNSVTISGGGMGFFSGNPLHGMLFGQTIIRLN